jgi:hypothetical protein
LVTGDVEIVLDDELVTEVVEEVEASVAVAHAVLVGSETPAELKAFTR